MSGKFGFTPRLIATFNNPSSGGAYTAGDNIANSATGSAVVPMRFSVARESGRILGCQAVVTPASGNLVITALDFDLLLFRPVASIPFAAAGYPADNAAMAISAAAKRELVARFRFSASSWINTLGATSAGITGDQEAIPYLRPVASFSVVGLTQELLGVVQALSAWTPGAVINRFDFALDMDYD